MTKIDHHRSTVPKECPNCGLLNSPEAQRCDCGYIFLEDSARHQYLDKVNLANSQKERSAPGGSLVFFLSAVPSVFLAVAAFGATLALGLYVPALQAMFSFVFGFSFVISYVVLGAGLVIGLRRLNPAPAVFGVTFFLAAVLVAAGNLLFTFIYSIYTK